MALKFIGFSFCICIILTLIFVNVFRPNSSVIFPSFILQLSAYAIMLILTFVISKTQIIKTITIYALSFIVSYLFLLLVLWRINASDFIETIIKLHKGKDFMSTIFPYIISNILMILYLFFLKINLIE
jgi:hypothetical protein